MRTESISSKIGLGTVQFGIDYGISNNTGIVDFEEVKKIIELAKLNGIDTIDTAFLYGDAHKKIGRANLNGLKVVSKFSVKNKKELETQLNKTLEDLKLDSIYGFISHNYLDIISKPELWNFLKEMQTIGKVKKIGFSFNKPSESEEVLKLGMIPDLVQIPYNYLDRRFEAMAKRLKKLGCEIHARSVFLQGLFFCIPNSLPDFFNPIKPILKKIQKEENFSIKILGSVYKEKFIDKIILGVDNSEQLNENLQINHNNTYLPDYNEIISEKILMPIYWPKK